MPRTKLSECVYVPGWETAPERPGVYMLYWGELCLYVGATTNLRARVKSHPHRMRCTGFRFVECARADLKRVEQEKIDALLPTLNRARASASPNRRSPAELAEHYARARREDEAKRKRVMDHFRILYPEDFARPAPKPRKAVSGGRAIYKT